MRRANGFSVCVAAVIAGCAVGPAYERPATDLPAAWQGAPEASGTRLSGEHWWTLYGDPALDKLIGEALGHNQDLALAVARVDEARALARVAYSLQFPGVGVSANRERSRSSEVGSMPLPSGTPIESNNYRAQLDVAYEVDLWGRLKSGSNAARATLLATEAARETVRIALVTEVVRGYYSLISFDAQIAATQRSLDLRSNGLELQKVRAKAGLINDFSLRQLEAEVAAAQSQLPALQANRTAQELALAVLAGRSPHAITGGTIDRRAEQGEPQPPVVPEGLPSDLLLRRPDIVEAEQRLIAANARISEARAALFPRILLTGYLGSESAALGNLFSGPAAIWSLAFGLTQPIFQAGRLFAEEEAAKARERQAVALYQKALQDAFREVRQGLSTQLRAREVYDSETNRAASLTEALRLARLRYQQGLISQLDIIDAERNLLQADLNRSDALRAQRAAVADLVKALGGGWQGLEEMPVAQQKSQ